MTYTTVEKFLEELEENFSSTNPMLMIDINKTQFLNLRLECDNNTTKIVQQREVNHNEEFNAINFITTISEPYTVIEMYQFVFFHVPLNVMKDQRWKFILVDGYPSFKFKTIIRTEDLHIISLIPNPFITFNDFKDLNYNLLLVSIIDVLWNLSTLVREERIPKLRDLELNQPTIVDSSVIKDIDIIARRSGEEWRSKYGNEDQKFSCVFIRNVGIVSFDRLVQVFKFTEILPNPIITPQGNRIYEIILP